MSAPAAVIRLELEAAPRVLIDCMNEREEIRLADWITSHPRLLDLVAAALELQNEAEAA
jgi:hypothetical protein